MLAPQLFAALAYSSTPTECPKMTEGAAYVSAMKECLGLLSDTLASKDLAEEDLKARVVATYKFDTNGAVVRPYNSLWRLPDVRARESGPTFCANSPPVRMRCQGCLDANITSRRRLCQARPRRCVIRLF